MSDASSRSISFVVWAVLGGATLVMVLLAGLGRAGLSRLGPLMAVAVRKTWFRAALLVGWAWFGWHLFAR